MNAIPVKAARLVFICAILLLLTGIAAAGSTLPPVPGHMTTLTTDHFYIKYNPEGKVPLTTTLDESLAAYAIVDTFFMGFHNKTTLIVADSYNEFRLITGIGDIPEDTTGLNFNEGSRGTVAIKSPHLVPNYRQVLTYHLARIMERTLMQEYHNPPEWFQDGLAAYVASDITDEQRETAAEKARTGNWMTLAEIEKVYANRTVYNENSPETLAARGQAFLLMEYVGQTYGNRTLVNILTDFGYSGNISQSFKNSTGHTPEKFNEDLRKVMFGPVATPVPTPPVIVKEYISGYVRDGAGNPVAGHEVTITGDKVNTTVTTNESGYYAAEVTFGLLKVNMQVNGYEYNNTVPVNPGENKVYDITINDLDLNEEARSILPALRLPDMPEISVNSTLAGATVGLVNLLALVWIVSVLRRNL
ncbi:carboxypeptidase-like regulatory domain-containing protein [Methanocella arvoryzae]|uniref:Carboxypeptidase regulatory-like domain-containing protein n=1 Tax=Methanocella arvoryzae (strain DSM 22066 / NBRC 105507 / MRE50) TaxID=351160 RepID=Q0W1S3_METAR|nr:carboxypeptidase-like regulatory domain-containing protein [Methanocella arvoryzae]CAJ37670.1 hypothetical protein RCIX2621 [Methanocella arvoryzae MRE50]